MEYPLKYILLVQVLRMPILYFISSLIILLIFLVYALDYKICDNEPLSLPFYDLPNSCYLEVKDVLHGLVCLRDNRSVGPDGLSGEFLYGIRSAISFPV